MNIPKELLAGNFGKAFGKLGDLLLEQVLSFLPDPLAKLITRLTSDKGDLAYEVAKAAWDAWEDDASLLEIAERAAREALDNGLGDISVRDIADWLGIIDREAAAE